MKKCWRIPVAFVGCAVAVGALVLVYSVWQRRGLLGPGRVTTPGASCYFFRSTYDLDERAGTPRKKALRTYRIALQLYRIEHDGLCPYDVEGSAAALYQLKEFFDRTGTAGGVPDFDDQARKIRDCPYEYINLKDLKLDDASPHLIVLAEKDSDERGGRWCLTSDGALRYVQSEKDSLVGKELDEIGVSP